MRRYKRTKLELDALVKPLNLNDLSLNGDSGDEGLTGTTKNISASGVMIELAEELGDNSYVMVHIYLDKSDFPKAIPGQKVWSKSHSDKSRTGIRFLTRQEVNELADKKMPQSKLGITQKEQDALDNLLGDILDLPDEHE